MGSDWSELAPRWERGRELRWESTRAVSEWLVDRLDPRPGELVLELSAGTGETGFLAAQRGARLISSDREQRMVEAAMRVAPSFGVSHVEFQVLDQEQLALPDAGVDGVLSRFGFALRGDRALREIRRVLRPGGRFALAVWAERERNPWMTVPADAVGVGVSEEAAALSSRRNPATIEKLLSDAGFGAIEFQELPVAYRFADADELWFFVSELRGPVATALERLDEAERAAVRSEVERRVGERLELGGVAVCVVTSRGA